MFSYLLIIFSDNIQNQFCGYLEAHNYVAYQYFKISDHWFQYSVLFDNNNKILFGFAKINQAVSIRVKPNSKMLLPQNLIYCRSVNSWALNVLSNHIIWYLYHIKIHWFNLPKQHKCPSPSKNYWSQTWLLALFYGGKLHNF